MGSLALVARQWVSTQLALPAPVVSLFGLCLIAFGLFIGWLAVTGRGATVNGLIIAGADAAWVLAVPVMIAMVQPSTSGVVLAIVISVPVAALAALQLIAALRMSHPSLVTVEVSQEVEATAADLWPVITNHDLYADLSPNLSRIVILGPERASPESWRRCWDVSGHHWDEALSVWDPPHSYAVAVNTTAADYPYPLEELYGRWSTSTSPSGASTVTMRFEFRARPGLAGAAFARILAARAPGMMGRIIDGWRRTVASGAGGPDGSIDSAPGPAH